MTPPASSGVRRAVAAVAAALGAFALLAGAHADAVAWLAARAALHRAAVAGLRAVGPVGPPASGAPRPDATVDAEVDAAAQASWASEPPAVHVLGVPRFVVAVTQRDGWPVVEVEARVAVELPWGVAGWRAEGPVVRVRGAWRR